ncbi:hypothetical protein DFJ77DRAFT_457549 [Powellomyces hirtus]|nr:hypothetical protein DFJ77DRAFT_457549 [Powellomyces hirtus]
MALSTEVISLVLDHLWDDIILNMDTDLFLNLLLVNKSFYSIVRRRHKELLRAHALLFNTTTTHEAYVFCGNPLSNPLVDPCAVLKGLCFELGNEKFTLSLGERIAEFVLRNHKRLDSGIGTSRFPVIFHHRALALSFASVHIKRLEHGPEYFSYASETVLLKNLTIDDRLNTTQEAWSYAVLIYLHPAKLYAFRKRQDGTPEVKVVKMELYVVYTYLLSLISWPIVDLMLLSYLHPVQLYLVQFNVYNCDTLAERYNLMLL